MENGEKKDGRVLREVCAFAVSRSERKSVHHHRETPLFSVCRPTPRSQSKKSYGEHHFPWKTREKGIHHRSRKKGIHHRASDPEKDKKEGFHGGGVYFFLPCRGLLASHDSNPYPNCSRIARCNATKLPRLGLADLRRLDASRALFLKAFSEPINSRTTPNPKARKSLPVFWPLFPLYARVFFPVVRHFFCRLSTEQVLYYRIWCLYYRLASTTPPLYAKPRAKVKGGCLSCDNELEQCQVVVFIVDALGF